MASKPEPRLHFRCANRLHLRAVSLAGRRNRCDSRTDSKYHGFARFARFRFGLAERWHADLRAIWSTDQADHGLPDLV